MAARFFAAHSDHFKVEAVGEELLVYDRRSDVAHCLSDVAAYVWSRCRDGASLEELVSALDSRGGTPDDAEALVLKAIAELQEKNLLEIGGGSGVSRRQVLRRLAGVGAAAFAAPLVVSAAIPKPADAAGSPASCVALTGACTPAGSAYATNNCCPSGTNNSSSPYCGPSGTQMCTACVASGSVPPAGTCAYACCNGLGCYTNGSHSGQCK